MKHFTLWKSFLLLCALVVGSNVWADTKTEGFEGSTTDTNYQSTKTITENQSDCGIGWSIYYGTPSVDSKITGNKSLQLRLYSNQKAGYAQTTTAIDGLNKVAFKVKVSDTNVKFNVCSSANGSSWTSIESNIALSSTSATDKEFNIPNGHKYFRIEVASGFPSSSNRKLTIDDVVFTYSIKTLSSIAVKTPLTTTEYKVGEEFSADGLSLTATYDDSSTKTIDSGFTFKIGEDDLDEGDALTKGTKNIRIFYGGKETPTQETIYVGELKSIAVTTAPTKTEYNQGQTFDPTGMVVTATYNTDDGHSWTEDVEDYTYSPTTGLGTSDTEITISYGGKTATQTVTVNAATAYTVSFNAGTGSCATASLTEAAGLAGVELPTATIGITGWAFAGWAEAATTNTQTAPTIYAAGETYHPVANCTLYAVYKFVEGTEGEYKRATALADVKSAPTLMLVNNYSSKTLTTDLSDLAALSEVDSKVTANSKAVFSLSGNDTDGYVLTGASGTIGASSLPSSNGTYEDIELTTTNNTWSINTSSSGTNHFVFVNKSGSNVGLEYTSSKWVAYRTSSLSSSQYHATKVYIPNFSVAYNSNPAAIVNPTVAFTTAGDKSLYVQDDANYTNVANVTGVAKTVNYTSSDATVATVSEAGVVTALKAGETTITATVDAELGVNTEASASYTVTVKDAKTIAGLKAITDASAVKTFTADLTDAIVTYVNGNYAYIQDASGAVYASCGTSLTAGKKINGAVSGSIKAAYKIDEITAIDITEATLTDGDIPAAEVKTLAQITAAGTDYEGKLVKVNGATVTATLNEGSASGGAITDDNKTTTMNLYAPGQNINVLKDAEGTFTGFISIYNASTYRLNIYEQSQIVLTKNAPTAQTLSFENDAIELDEETSAFTAFAGQTVSGAKGTVTYALTGDAIGTVNETSGAVTLNGTIGTATITAIAAAKEVTEAGVTTPYTETSESYTVTVYPRYTSTFSVNGIVTVIRQATHDAEIVVPTPDDAGDYYFMGWKATSGIATPTDEAPEMVTPPTTPTSNVTYYAVYAQERAGGEEEVTSTLNLKQTEPAGKTSTINGVTWSWSNLTFATSGNNVGMKGNDNATVTIDMPDNAIKANRISLVRSQDWGAATVVVSNSDGTIGSIGQNGNTYVDFTSTNNTSSQYTLSQSTSKNAWISSFTLTYSVIGTENYGYCTSLPTVAVSIGASEYASFCYDRALDFSTTDVNAYIAKVEAGKVKLTKVEDGIVPANKGVVLYGAEGSYEIPVAASAGSFDFTSNQMIGVTVRTQVFWNPSAGVYNYILQSGTFNKANDGFLKPNRAYLSTDFDVATLGGSKLTIIFDDDETTSINNIEEQGARSKVQEGTYNLAGQKVSESYKGIVIVNGKKVVRK